MRLTTTLFSAKSASRASGLTIRQRAQHQWPAILENAGIDPIYLQNRHGPCPACGGVDRFHYDDRTGNGDYFCNQCGAGHGISLLMKTHAWTAQEALQAVSRGLAMERYGPEVTPPRRPVAAVTAPSPATIERAQRRIQRLWGQSFPLDDPKAEVASVYFAYRGLTNLSPLPCDVRLHPALPYWWQDSDSNVIEIGQWPALLAVVRTTDGKVRGLHRTYLQPDGQGKAQVLSPPGEPLPAKKLLSLAPGATRGCAVQLLYPVTEGRFAVAEGLETALAVSRANPGWPCWAALFAGNLAHVEIPAAVETVAIMADNDSNNVGQTAGKALARRLFRLSKPPTIKLRIPPNPDTDWLDVWGDRRHG